MLRLWTIAIVALSLVACARRDGDVAKDPVKTEKSTDSLAKKAGAVAHEIADETKEAAKKVGKTLKKAAKEAHEGWEEAERKDKAQGKKSK